MHRHAEKAPMLRDTDDRIMVKGMVKGLYTAILVSK
jgi:hypothetical protein